MPRLLDMQSAAIAFAILALTFVPLERAFARRPQRIVREEFFVDCLFFFGQILFWQALIVGALVWLRDAFAYLPLHSMRGAFAQLPFLAQAVIAVLLGDALIYWGHRLSHRVPWLWRFHRVHHTSDRLDWIAAYREHPVDGLYTQVIENLPALLLGFHFEAIAGLIAFRSVWGVFIHSNARVPVGPLRWLVGSPDLHHFHHDRDRGGEHNFANLMPLMDMIFGTYANPRRDPIALGVTEPVARGYFAQLLSPWRST